MYHQLTESERYTLSVLHRDGQSLRAIARILERSPSTISREVRRNRCHRTDGAYRPSKAQERTNGRRRKRTSGPERRGKLQGKPMIDTRPVEVENRVEVGHWEGDTVIGTVGERDCLLTLVERSTGLAVVTKLPHRTVKAVNRAAVEAIERCGLPFKTITWDNGTEFHGYRAIEQATDVRCYFAYPHHPWERGSNENFNGLLRQYLPKRKSLARINQADCDRITHKLNTRPRKRHGYKIPIERLHEISGVLHLGC